MNIARVSNTTFKSAYIIKGSNDAVKKAEDIIRPKLENGAQIDRLGDYTAIMAYSIITTGRDTLEYNKFAQNKQKYYEDMAHSMPERRKREIFATDEDYLNYKARHAGKVWVETVAENCAFDDANSPDVFDANLVLDAIEADCFDCNTGKFDILKQQK